MSSHLQPLVADQDETSSKHFKGFNPVVAIAGVIAIAVVISFVSYASFDHPSKDYSGYPVAKTAKKPAPAVESQAQKFDSTSAENTLNSLDKDFKTLDDDTDFNPADLSDSSLGL